MRDVEMWARGDRSAVLPKTYDLDSRYWLLSISPTQECQSIVFYVLFHSISFYFTSRTASRVHRGTGFIEQERTLI